MQALLKWARGPISSRAEVRASFLGKFAVFDEEIPASYPPCVRGSLPYLEKLPQTGVHRVCFKEFEQWNTRFQQTWR